MSAVKKAIEMLSDIRENLCVYIDDNGDYKVLRECLDDDTIISIYKLVGEVKGLLEALDNVLNPTKQIIYLIETGQYNVSRLKPFIVDEQVQS